MKTMNLLFLRKRIPQ